MSETLTTPLAAAPTAAPVRTADGPPKELIYKRPVSLRRSLVQIWRQREIPRTLAERALRARYKQAMLGFLWAIITPLALMFVFTLLFEKAQFARLETAQNGIKPPYPVFAYMGLLPWSFFSGAISAAATSIIQNVALINKISCPREAWPLSTVLVAATDTVLSLLALAGIFVVTGFTPHIQSFWVPLITLVLLVFTIGMSLLVAVWVVYVRDLRHGIPLILQLGLFATPVAYGFDEFVPGRWQWLYSLLNPLGPIIDAYRRTVVYGQNPNWTTLGIGAIGATVVFLVGYWMFKRMEAGIADVA